MSVDYKKYDKEDLEVITETKRKFLPERIVKIDQNIGPNPNVCALNRVFTKWNVQSGLSIEYIYIYKSLYPDSYGIEIKLSKYKRVLCYNYSYTDYSTNTILYNIVSYLFAFQPKLKYDLDSALKRYFLMYKKDDDEFHEFITNKYYETNPKVKVDKEIPFNHMEAYCLLEKFKDTYANMQENTLTDIYCILNDTNKVLDYITEKFLVKYNILLQQFDGKTYFPCKNMHGKWKDLKEEKNNIGYTKSKCVNIIHIKDTDIYLPVVFVYDMIENMVQPLFNLSVSYAVNAYDFDCIDLELEKRFVIYVLSNICDIDKKFTKIEEYQGKTQHELNNEKFNK